MAGQARVLTQIGYRAYLAGAWDQAVVAYSRAKDLVERLGDLPNVAVANANIAEILVDQGRLAEAEVALHQAIRVWRASGSDNEVAFGRALLGRVMAKQGRYTDAESLLDQARTRFAEQGAKTEVVDADTYRAECRLLSGAPAEALVLATATLRAAGRLSDQPVQAPLLYRIIGNCRDALGETAQGDVAFDQALVLARRRGADHEIGFTLAAIMNRSRDHAAALEPALVNELGALQRRLGLVVDLTAVESAPTAAVIGVPQPRTRSDETPITA
jgi:tetratricopeptide (TPR) repeat protein